ncbi:ATP-dependent DNA helicase Q4 [Nerophis ophidion]|uniref:ATP-dependent DNA helicase Q4 n=1 Tax=Nerophis ophidion TaxID=159077 RepID=UPI002AE07BA3|nr:ATP-dependent DNA helicase Q4 [Nerophis ophidion]
MDRYNEVKLLLKTWEQGFVEQHHRKPNKEDVDEASEETKNLYKEYRSLKQAKENSSGSSDATSKPIKPTQKESECWGSHLNRSVRPASLLRVTDKDSLKASAQYYGLKFKHNLATLTHKEKAASLKRSGRVPLNFLKDDVRKTNLVTSSSNAEFSPLSPRRIKLGLSSKVQPVESEDPFKAFQPVAGCTRESLSSVKGSDTRKICANTDEEASSAGSLANTGGEKDTEHLKGASHGSLVDVCVGTATSNGSPCLLGGIPVGIVSKVADQRPSPASRLGFVDKKWLERCQVFREMEAEERPGAGNQERVLVVGKKDKEEDVVGKDFIQEKKTAVRNVSTPNESEIEAVPVQQCTGKQGNTVEHLTTSLPAEDPPSSSGAKKRQREMEMTQGEEGGPKKRRQNAKKSGKCDGKVEEGGGKRRTKRSKKKGKDNDEAEAEEDTQVPRRLPQENLLGEIEEEYSTKRSCRAQSARARGTKAAEGNFVKINLKKKSHVKGYALRGLALRKQLYMQKFQLKGERFGGGYFCKGKRGGFRGGHSRLSDTCYKCGGTGHWAIDCKGAAPLASVPDNKPVVEEPFELPTLEEVARATGTLQPQQPQDEEQQLQNLDNKDEALLNVIRPDYERLPPPQPVEPLYGLTDDGKVQATPGEVFAALQELGYGSFRAGQEEAIMRILSGLSTLVVLSTGMGKSLCYQLPAYLYAKRSKCITLVISPLVSLMDDQLSGLPAKLKAVCIHSNMTMKQREAAVEKVKTGQVCVLLLSPEALVGGGRSSSGCLPTAQELPPVAFACIDEAHCVSEWSHNFRPCYLRLCKVLRERLGVKCLLGLTATATLSTALDIAQHLDINDQDGIAVRSAAVPTNLHLSVSMDREKDHAVVSLLKGDRFGCLDSIIVYCTRREETTRVAALLRTCLQGVLLKENKHIISQTQSNPVGQRKKELARKKIRKPLKWQAESYHAGLSASERRRVQNNFMCGELRIVVATVAFGMGLDKSDVRGIVHYNMPKSFESYVQEIGRAGRDGEPAHCHLFLDPEGMDLPELRRHIYSDTVDYYTVKRLVEKVFPVCKCKKIHQKQQELTKEDVDDAELLEMMELCEQESSLNPCAQQEVAQSTDSSHPGRKTEEKSDELEVQSKEWPRERVCHTHERAIPIQETVEALDITEEGIETLLCYLELHPQRFVELLHSTLSVCKVSCYDGPRQLQKVTKICAPVAVVLARRRMAGELVETWDQLEFDVVEVADTMGWQLPLVKRGLRQLQWSFAGGRSGIHVEFSSLSFYFRSYGDLSDEELDRVCQFLHKRVQDQERSQLYQLSACFKAFKSVAFQNVVSCMEDLDEARSFQLKDLLSDYFDKRRDRDLTQHPLDVHESLDQYKILDWENQIRADIRSFLSTRSDEKFTGRAIARILHGIGSPCYPAQTYGRDRRYWRKYIQFDFNQLIRIATQEIIQFK